MTIPPSSRTRTPPAGVAALPSAPAPVTSSSPLAGVATALEPTARLAGWAWGVVGVLVTALVGVAVLSWQARGTLDGYTPRLVHEGDKAVIEGKLVAHDAVHAAERAAAVTMQERIAVLETNQRWIVTALDRIALAVGAHVPPAPPAPGGNPP